MEKHPRIRGVRWPDMQRIADNIRAADLPPWPAQDVQPACSRSSSSCPHDAPPVIAHEPSAPCAETNCAIVPPTGRPCGTTFRVEGRMTLWPEHDASCRCHEPLTWDVRFRHEP